MYKSCGLLLSLSPFSQILHHQLRGIILYKSCGLLLSLSQFTQIIHNWLRETILYKSCGLLLSLSSVTWILHHQLRGIISYSVNAGFKRFYRVLRGVKKILCFIHRKIWYSFSIINLVTMLSKFKSRITWVSPRRW